MPSVGPPTPPGVGGPTGAQRRRYTVHPSHQLIHRWVRRQADTSTRACPRSRRTTRRVALICRAHFESDLLQAKGFHAVARGIDTACVAIDAENLAGRGRHLRRNDRDIPAVRTAIKHTHARADTGRAKQPFRRWTQPITSACEPLAFPVRASPCVLVGHATDRHTPAHRLCVIGRLRKRFRSKSRSLQPARSRTFGPHSR